MELDARNGFFEIAEDEMLVIDGGSIVTDALAIVGYFAGCAVAGWNAGRALAKDIKRKFFN